jgi:hypothetical protein
MSLEIPFWDQSKGDTLYLTGELDGMLLEKEPCEIIYPDIPELGILSVQVVIKVRGINYQIHGLWKRMEVYSANYYECNFNRQVEIKNLQVVS